MVIFHRGMPTVPKTGPPRSNVSVWDRNIQEQHTWEEFAKPIGMVRGKGEVAEQGTPVLTSFVELF